MVESLSNEFTGVVAWFSSAKGFGFITRDNGAKDLFAHFSNIEMEGFKALKPGQKVSFEIGKNDFGPQAVKIKVLAEPKE